LLLKSAPDVRAKDDFCYDLVGNRTKAYLKSDTATTYLHDPVNELTKVDNTAYEYDAAGNLTKDGTHSYYWDYENRLTRVKLVSDSSHVAEYTYDALGRRVEKVDQTGETDVTTRWYLDRWSVVEERDGDDALQATYVNGARLDEYILMNRNSTNYWYMESPIIRNVAALVSSSGAIQEGYTYRGYGQATVHTGAGNDGAWFTADDVTAASSALGNRYLFTGRERDPETGLYYFRFRMYDPAKGTFISRDLLGYVNGMSLYLYVAGRALLITDPLGLCGGNSLNPLDWLGGALQAAGGLLGELAEGALHTGGNVVELVGGLSNFDPGENPVEGALETLGHLTWGLPNTALGFLWGLPNVLTGGDVVQDGDTTWVVGGALNNSVVGGAFTSGPYVNANSNYPPTDGYQYTDSATGLPTNFNVPIHDHEEGHEDQSLLLGPLYIPLALLSGTGIKLENWFDTWANLLNGTYNICNPATFPGLK